MISITPERINKETDSFTLEVDPSLLWQNPQWAGQDFKMDGLRLEATITISARGKTNKVTGLQGDKSKTQTVTLSESPGNLKVGFFFDSYDERFVN